MYRNLHAFYWFTMFFGRKKLQDLLPVGSDVLWFCFKNIARIHDADNIIISCWPCHMQLTNELQLFDKS